MMHTQLAYPQSLAFNFLERNGTFVTGAGSDYLPR